MHELALLVSGAMAGISVDLVLFPLDTIKTRLQSRKGILSSGGFKRGLFQGLAPALLVSGPNAAIFFFTYECMKKNLQTVLYDQPLLQSFGASIVAEVAA